jgi:hypothetical protein
LVTESLIRTIVFEYIVYLVALRTGPFQLLLYSVLINCLTQPVAYYVFNRFMDSSAPNDYSVFNFYFVIIEISVILIESYLIFLLMKLNYAKSLALSAAANLVTASLSFVAF